MLTQSDFVKTQASLSFFPPQVVDFPLGEQKTVSYSFNSWIKKPYAIHFNLQHLASIEDYDKKIQDIPYRFSVSCYKLENTKKTLFFKDTYYIRDHSYQVDNDTVTIRDNLFEGGQSWDSENPNHQAVQGWSSTLLDSGFDLPYGEYQCDFKDESPEEIKKYLQEAGIVKTAITIGPYKEFIY